MILIKKVCICPSETVGYFSYYNPIYRVGIFVCTPPPHRQFYHQVNAGLCGWQLLLYIKRVFRREVLTLQHIHYSTTHYMNERWQTIPKQCLQMKKCKVEKMERSLVEVTTYTTTTSSCIRSIIQNKMLLFIDSVNNWSLLSLFLF